jgi:hypothetical protein
MSNKNLIDLMHRDAAWEAIKSWPIDLQDEAILLYVETLGDLIAAAKSNPMSLSTLDRFKILKFLAYPGEWIFAVKTEKIFLQISWNNNFKGVVCTSIKLL